MFEPTVSPSQERTLAALETLLALVEGWVDTVVAEAVGDRLPGAAALQETLRRRRATGGPAELDGNEIMAALGIGPGREVGTAYRHLLELRLERGPLPKASPGRAARLVGRPQPLTLPRGPPHAGVAPEVARVRWA